MKINVYAAYSHVLEKDTKDATAIIVDTLRATSTMITALYHGCAQIIPAGDVDDVMQIARSLGSHAVLGGERDSNLIPGFDLSNSPLEYNRDKLEGKSLVMTTSNGTAAITQSKNARHVLIGALINDAAVARRAVELGLNTTIVCAGNDGKMSLEDLVTAGAIVVLMEGMLEQTPELDDMAKVARTLYGLCAQDIVGFLRGSRHYEVLVENGWEQDIAYCCQQGVIELVPVYAEGIISV
ncbi:MAG: 2-phosphosulfolactate phosphatase [Christensenellales bacterium]